MLTVRYINVIYTTHTIPYDRVDWEHWDILTFSFIFIFPAFYFEIFVISRLIRLGKLIHYLIYLIFNLLFNNYINNIHFYSFLVFNFYKYYKFVH